MPAAAWSLPIAIEWNALLFARSGFRVGGVSWFVICTLVVLAIVALWMLARWRRGESTGSVRNSPRALFYELCRVHALASAERQLLWALAEGRQFAQPSQVFVDPGAFDDDRMPPALSGRRSELARLRDRLFDGLEKPGDSAAATASVADPNAALVEHPA
jgi:hypothetical protein